LGFEHPVEQSSPVPEAQEFTSGIPSGPFGIFCRKLYKGIFTTSFVIA